jgi:hypothetical protein
MPLHAMDKPASDTNTKTQNTSSTEAFATQLNESIHKNILKLNRSLTGLRKCNLLRMVILLVGFIALPAFAQKSGFPTFTSSPNANGSTTYTLNLQTLLLLLH